MTEATDDTTRPAVPLGSGEPAASPIGLGCMAMSGVYGAADRTQSIATIHAALDAGVTLLDTGDFYGAGHNELLVGEALRQRGSSARDEVTLSVKFGALIGPDGYPGGAEGRPEHVRNALAYTLTRLGTDHVDVYRPARLDPAVPIEETVGAIAELVKAGYVRQIGLSEVGPETIRRAAAVHPIIDLQIEYSLLSRGPEDAILPTLRELGIGLTAYGVLTRGLLSGGVRPGQDADPGDFRGRSPRFTGEALQHNASLADALAEVGTRHGVSAAQLAIAWVLSRRAGSGVGIVPLVGARRPDRVAQALDAVPLAQDAALMAEVEAAVPAGSAQGERYPAAAMAHLDSER